MKVLAQPLNHRISSAQFHLTQLRMLSLCHMSPLLGDFMALLFRQLALKISDFFPPGSLLSIEKGPLSVVLGGPEQQSLLLLPRVVKMV